MMTRFIFVLHDLEDYKYVVTGKRAARSSCKERERERERERETD